MTFRKDKSEGRWACTKGERYFHKSWIFCLENNFEIDWMLGPVKSDTKEEKKKDDSKSKDNNSNVDETDQPDNSSEGQKENQTETKSGSEESKEDTNSN